LLVYKLCFGHLVNDSVVIKIGLKYIYVYRVADYKGCCAKDLVLKFSPVDPGRNREAQLIEIRKRKYQVKSETEFFLYKVDPSLVPKKMKPIRIPLEDDICLNSHEHNAPVLFQLTRCITLA
jgi:hypothetical protein